MSPTEDDLRAALRDGDGEGGGGLNAETIMWRAQAQRARRRTQLLGGAATVVFVGALATGVALLANGGDDSGSSSSTSSRVGGAKAAAPDPSSAARSAMSTGTASGCPSTPSHQLLPGGGSPGQFGSDGKLFADPVDSLVVCGYTAGPQQRASGPASVQLTGDEARAIVSSLENAPTTRSVGTNCPDYEPAIQRTLVFLATATDGTHERAVTATINGPACRNQVTNGTAVRYAWTPPLTFQPTVQKLTPNVGTNAPQNTVSGGGNRKHGSPIHS